MVNDWLTELLYGIKTSFLKSAALLGGAADSVRFSRRIRKERNNFGTKGIWFRQRVDRHMGSVACFSDFYCCKV